MEWLEISVRVDPEAAEAVAEVLSRYVSQGVAIDQGLGKVGEPVTVRAYVLDGERAAEVSRQIEEALWHLGQIWPIPDPTHRTVSEKEWTAAWKESIPVLHLGHRIVIKPSWREYTPQPEEIVLEMDPGLAFGTGLHPTTRLCVGALERLLRPGMKVLDVGTGTGILSLAAAKLAPVEVFAVDNDADAVSVARRNVRANGVRERVQVSPGSWEVAKGRYDLVLVNILTHTILAMLEGGLTSRVRTGGWLVGSGILLEQEAEVAAALERAGLRVVESLHEGDWIAIVAQQGTLPEVAGAP